MDWKKKTVKCGKGEGEREEGREKGCISEERTE
jgi:hypothetical protein